MIDQAIEVLLQRARDFGRSTGARAVSQALGPLLGKALHPFAHSRIGQLEGDGDGGDGLPRDHRTDGLRTAKDPCFLGLLEESV